MTRARDTAEGELPVPCARVRITGGAHPETAVDEKSL